MLDKLQKQICRTVGPSLAASLEPLAHCQNVASWFFSIGITLIDVHLSWLNWFHFLILEWVLLVILTSVLIKCILSCGCAWITLSIGIPFTLLFCLANFVNWHSLSDWMGFEEVDIQVSVFSFFSEILLSFGLSHGLLLLHSQKFRLSTVLMKLFFFFYFLP